MRWIFAVLLLALSGSPLIASEPLTNSDVLKMHHEGFSEATILTRIRTSKTDFALDTEALIFMKRAGIPETVINAMMIVSSDEKSPVGSPAEEPAGIVGIPPNVSIPGALQVGLNFWNGKLAASEQTIRFECAASECTRDFAQKWADVWMICWDDGPLSSKIEIHRHRGKRFKFSAAVGESVLETERVARKFMEALDESRGSGFPALQAIKILEECP